MTYTHANIRTLAILPLIAIVFVFVMCIDRLTSASGTYGSITYAYNKIGNMTANTQLGAYTCPVSGANNYSEDWDRRRR